MEDMRELFRKIPFIYRIQGEYYAFGSGVCEKCYKSEMLVTRYEDYLKIMDEDVEDEDAWLPFLRVFFVANNAKGREPDENAYQKFSELGFDEESLLELQRQMDDMVDYFRKHHMLHSFRFV